MNRVKRLGKTEVDGFLKNLYLEERSENTVSKYRRDIERFRRFLAGERPLEREAVVAYKRYLLGEGYKASSVNSMLAAVNALLAQVDLLIDGPFVLEQRNLELRFRGSENQRLIDMRKTREQGHVVLVEE